MSENAILSRFCKSGEWNHLSRRYHNLEREQKQYLIELIQQGETPEKALKLAKIKQQKLF